MWNFFSFNKSKSSKSDEQIKKLYNEDDDQEMMIMSGGAIGSAAKTKTEKLKQFLKKAQKQELKAASIFLHKKQKLIREFPDFKLKTAADRLQIPQSFEMATLKGAIQFLERIRDIKIQSEMQANSNKASKKSSKEPKQPGGNVKQNANKKEADKTVGELMDIQIKLMQQNQALQVDNESLRGKVQFFAKQLKQNEKELEQIKIRNKVLETERMYFDEKLREINFMTQAEIKKYEKINLKLQRQKNKQAESIKELSDQLEKLKGQHSQNFINSLSSEVKQQQREVKEEEKKSQDDDREEEKSLKSIQEKQQSNAEQNEAIEQKSSLLWKFMTADKKTSPRIWLPIMKFRIQYKIKKMHILMHQKWSEDSKFKQLLIKFLSGKYKTGGHFEQCVMETQKFISQKYIMLERRKEQLISSQQIEGEDVSGLGAGLGEGFQFSTNNNNKNPAKNTKKPNSFMNKISGIFKKKKDQPPTPKVTRRATQTAASIQNLDMKQMNKEDYENQAKHTDEEIKSKSQSSEQTSSQTTSASSDTRTRANYNSSTRSSFVSTTSNDQVRTLEFRSVPEIMNYLQDIRKLERVKNFLKS